MALCIFHCVSYPYPFYIFLLPTAHNHTKGIVVSEGACRAAHHSCADVSGKFYAPEAVTKHNVQRTYNIYTQSKIHCCKYYLVNCNQLNKSHHLQ